MALVDEAMKASMPGTAKQFLGSVQPKPMGQMIMYMGILGILPILGYVIGGLIGWGGIGWGILMGIMTAVAIIAGAIAAGFILSAISQGSLGRQISSDEGITLVGYACTPIFILAFLTGLISGGGWLGVGLWGAGSLFMFLGMLYMAYLVYQGAGARYGMDKAVMAAIVALIAFGIGHWIVMMIAWQLAWGMVYTGVRSDVSRALDLARAYGY